MRELAKGSTTKKVKSGETDTELRKDLDMF
jgi:hypothetical protein